MLANAQSGRIRGAARVVTRRWCSVGSRFVRLMLHLVLLAVLAWSGFASAADEGPVTAGVVRIGLLLDFSGPYAYLAGEPTLIAARMAVEDFGGTVLGRPVEVLYADHHNNIEQASSLAREWFNSGVDAVMDVTGSAPALAVAKIAARANRIAVFNTVASSRLTNEACTPVTLHWAFDGYALAHVTGRQLVRDGGDSWYFVTADWGLGQALEKETAEVVRAAGGRVLGSSLHAMSGVDFNRHLERAQDSGAAVVALATVGRDFIEAMRAAVALGIGAPSRQRLAALLGYINDIHTLGLETTQGLYLTSAFYWDLNDSSRAWAGRFYERTKAMPNQGQAGVYTATLHYLKAVQAAGTDRTEAVMRKMRELPVEFFGKAGRVREDGRMVHDMYLLQVKSPAKSKGPWDVLELRATVSGDNAFRPLSESMCPLVMR
jgi:branched-chain amino acid transport system substrate-binding protein